MRSRDLAVKLACSGLGLGYLPLAPGTWASAAAATLYWWLRRTMGLSALAPVGLLCAATVLGGLLLAPRAERLYDGVDPRRFVLDELAGCWLGCLLFWWRGPVVTAGAVFVAFRFFDVAKPFPLKRLEKLPGGWGVMADDLGAALCAAATLWPLCYGVIDLLVR